MLAAGIIIGGLAMTAFFLIFNYTQKKQLTPPWWFWSMVISDLFYFVFVFLMMSGFLAEGNGRAAMIMGLIFGFPAILLAVFLGRYIKRKPGK